MGIVSYAQNFEDVMLWRALKDVKNGFYIDVGANHPVVDSVTQAFYENGWNGINVEPELELYELLKAERDRDINLNMAISASAEFIEFHVSSIRGWSTTDKKSSDNLKDKDSFSEIRIVQAISLDKLCKEYTIEEIHFLKIDVEGAEKDVLESFAFDTVRPWICVVEATKPTTPIDVSYEWEEILFHSDYLFAYFDGVNKYYVSSEHSELIEVLKIPPNIFDEFIRSDHRDFILRASEAESRANEAEVQAKNAWNNYHIVVNSNSWKITKPLRLIGQFARWFMRGSYHWITFSPTSRPCRIIKNLVLKIKYYINARPVLKNRVMNLLNHFPTLKARLKKIRQTDYSLSENSKFKIQNSVLEYTYLTPRSKEIYHKLKVAIKENKKNVK